MFGISALSETQELHSPTFGLFIFIYCMVNVGKCGIDGLLGDVSGMILVGPFHASSPGVWMSIGND